MYSDLHVYATTAKKLPAYCRFIKQEKDSKVQIPHAYYSTSPIIITR